MCFDESNGSEIEASNFTDSNRPVCVALGVADGREWISIQNTSIEPSNWGLEFKRRRLEDLKLPVKDKEQCQNGCF